MAVPSMERIPLTVVVPAGNVLAEFPESVRLLYVTGAIFCVAVAL